MTKYFILTVLLCSSAILFQSCDKVVLDGNSSEFLPVEKKNSSLRIFYTSPQLSVCGSFGFPKFYGELANYDSTEVLMSVAPGNFGGAESDTIFEELGDAFGFFDNLGLIYLPKFQTNFDTTLSLPAGVATHNTEEVVANSAYELEFSASTITINTTTEFFQNAEGDFYLSAYLLVDSIVANQAGSVDGANTIHRRSLVDIGRPPGYEPSYLGYRVATGNTDIGYKFNLSFEVPRDLSWPEDQISVALILSKQDGVSPPEFVNANTNH